MAEAVLEQIEKPSGGLPWVPIRDRDGWIPIRDEEDLERVQAYFAPQRERVQSERARLVERFEEAVRQR